jgi:hypothetical protein
METNKSHCSPKLEGKKIFLLMRYNRFKFKINIILDIIMAGGMIHG